jgi:hypothetical protein
MALRYVDYVYAMFDARDATPLFYLLFPLPSMRAPCGIPIDGPAEQWLARLSSGSWSIIVPVRRIGWPRSDVSVTSHCSVYPDGKKAVVEQYAEDQPVLNYIQRLVGEEHRLYEKRTLLKSDRKRLTQIQVELDQCWDLLRQRRALRGVGLDPDEAEVRPPQVVENYEQ